MKFKLFTRTEDGSAAKTLRYFAKIAAKERGTVIRFSLEITTNHLLRFVILPLILSLFVQALVTGASNNYLYTLIGLGIIAAGLSTWLNTVGFDRMFRHEERAQNDLTKLAVANLLGHSYQFFSNKRVGTLAGDAMGFIKSYTSFLDISFMNLNGLAIGLVAGLVVVAIMAPILLLPLSLLLIALTVLNIRGLNRRAPYRNERKERTSKLNGIIADIMGNQLLTKVFARETHEEKQVLHERKLIERVSYKEIDSIKRDVTYRQVVVYSFQFATLLIVIWMASHSAISIAALVFIVTYIMRVTDSMFSISSLVRQYEQVFLDAAPMIKILEKSHDVVDTPDAKKLAVRRGAITCSNVTFSYEGAKTDSVFRNLQLSIPAGQRLGLAGPSGGGKTTLTKLLLRFADIDSGSIAIDDQNISRVTQESLRQAISYVPQEPLLFHRTLRENIAYGRPQASDDEIIDAAKKANAWDFIEKLPAGLDTIVGERGVKLSGGQRQRVAIARAILKDAPILILDEATSALDSESEKLIQAALENLMKDRTSIVIAHRLSTIAKLDRIIVLDNGTIIEDGTHAELLKQNGTYAKLWSHQSGGFIEE